MSDKIAVAQKLLTNLMSSHIIVTCTTCKEVFLDMAWNTYLWLLDGDYATPTKWYNKVALHYCQYPEHQILSNRDPNGFNRQFNFSEAFKVQLANAGITVFDFIQVVREKEMELKDAPV